MPSRRVATEQNTGTYYLTLTVQRWYYLFDRYSRWQIMSDSIRYCQDNKGLELNAYVFMLNPIHLIVTSADMAGFLRDFKSLTIFTKIRYEKVMFPVLNIGFGHRPTRLRRSLPNFLRHDVIRLTTESRTVHVALFEKFCFGYVLPLSSGIVKTLGTGLQTPSRLGVK